MPENELLRSFIAIPLPPSLQQQIGKLQQQLRRQLPELKTPRIENLHLTLHFLGDQPHQLLAEIGQLMLSIGEKKKNFNVTLKGLGCFPDMKRPRILWLGVDPPTELFDLYQQSARLLTRVGLCPAQRRYHPHLTIGRFRSKPVTTENLCPFLSHRCGSLKIDRMVLYTSHLTAQGAVHEPLATAMLTGSEN